MRQTGFESRLSDPVWTEKRATLPPYKRRLVQILGVSAVSAFSCLTV